MLLVKRDSTLFFFFSFFFFFFFFFCFSFFGGWGSSSNILYPRASAEKVLKLTCKNCNYEETASTGIIYRHEVLHSMSERSAIISDVTTDPTLPRTKEVSCPQCQNQEAVFFQSTSRSDAEAMTLFFVCTGCGHRWRE